jgi:hypothetical protein
LPNEFPDVTRTRELVVIAEMMSRCCGVKWSSRKPRYSRKKIYGSEIPLATVEHWAAET